ncbi:DNA recombination protein RmuC, partial [Chloroflexota bacterium]
FGELGLERLLMDSLPSASYSLQHRFRNGQIVDAVVQIGGNLVPIDSKFPFPLEDFERMVTEESPEGRSHLRRQFARTIKKHIDDVSKYILPDENTFGFALMYIPAENIYYETIIQDPLATSDSSLYSYCCERKVFPVSPNSFYVYLQAIALGLKGLQLEKTAHDILGQLGRLQGDLHNFQEDYTTLGTHIGHAARKYDEAGRKLARLDDKLQLAGETQAEKLPEISTEIPAEEK